MASLARLWLYGNSAEKWVSLGGWLLSLAASIGLGLATVIFGWSGIPLPFGDTEVDITIHAPHIICLWWTLQIGWRWLSDRMARNGSSLICLVDGARLSPLTLAR